MGKALKDDDDKTEHAFLTQKSGLDILDENEFIPTKPQSQMNFFGESLA